MSLISYLKSPHSITSLEMNALTVFILCAALIASSGLQWFPNLQFGKEDPCSACKYMFDYLDFPIHFICPNTKKLYEILKASV
jgi:hypothetical protein